MKQTNIFFISDISTILLKNLAFSFIAGEGERKICEVSPIRKKTESNNGRFQNLAGKVTAASDGGNRRSQ
jgi:hypothetical protein